MSAPCRSCGQSGLKLIMPLGKTPLANALLTEAQLKQPEPKYPLDLAFCPDCTLVQITETVSPEILFREYLYFSSTSDAMLAHARAVSERLVRDRQLGPDSLVIEVASNDGYLLKNFKQAGVQVLGIEPARNIAAVAEKNGIQTVPEFFCNKLAQKLHKAGTRADVLIGNNVLAHIAELNGFMHGVAMLLKEEGIAQFEVPYVKDLIDRCEFDTIYHEHLCYFSLTALDHIAQRHGLRVVEVERIPIHGGSLRVQMATAHSDQPVSEAVTALLQEEEYWGVGRFEYYADFALRVDMLGKKLHKLLVKLKMSGSRIAAYGAAAKGSTLLNYFAIDHELVDFVVDRSPYKQGRFMPGVHIPILAPDALMTLQPDYTLMLTWNFADEILEQQAAYRKRGGKFIIPVPEPILV